MGALNLSLTNVFALADYSTHLDFDLVEGLAVVNADDGAGHLGNDDHVSEMGLDNVGLLVDGALLLLLPQLLDEGHRLPLQPAAELSADAAGQKLHQLLVVHVEELVQVHPAVGELAEGSLLLELSGSLKSKDNKLMIQEGFIQG